MDLSHSPIGRFVVVLLLLSSWARGAEELSAPPNPGSIQAPCTRDDELWLISTRHLCFPDWKNPSTFELDVRRCDHNSGWRNSSLAEFLAEPDKATVVYVHANRTNWCQAIEQGQMVHQSLVSCFGNAPAMRFVIWSWPSDPIPGPLRDIRVKADRADAEGSFFGWFLSQLTPGTSIGLIGYSYGVRIISGGLQLLGGGVLNGHTLPQPPSGHSHIRAVYLASAMNRDWVFPSGYHGQSLSQVDRLLITYNPCDPALKRFRTTDPCTRPVALGYNGVYAGGLGEAANRVEQLDVSAIVGRSHDEMRYWCSSVIWSEICRVVFESVQEHVILPANEITSNHAVVEPTVVSAPDTQPARAGRIFRRRR